MSAIDDLIAAYNCADEMNEIEKADAWLTKQEQVHTRAYLMSLKDKCVALEDSTDNKLILKQQKALNEYECERIRQTYFKLMRSELSNVDKLRTEMEKKIALKTKLIKTLDLAIEKFGENLKLEV